MVRLHVSLALIWHTVEAIWTGINEVAIKRSTKCDVRLLHGMTQQYGTTFSKSVNTELKALLKKMVYTLGLRFWTPNFKL